MAPRHEPFEGTATVVLKRAAPAWYWARKNFSAASLLTIAGIIAAAIADHVSLTTRVALLEKDNVHAATVADLASRQTGLEARVVRLEQAEDRRAGIAEEAPQPHAARRGTAARPASGKP